MNRAQPPKTGDTPFYTSGTFWAIAAVVVTVIGIAVSAWVTWRTTNPKRQLNIWIDSDTPLMTTTTAGVEVSFQGTPLTDPHIVRVRIAARGRKDIVPADFTGPIRIDLDTSVVRLISTESATKRDSLPPPVLTVDNTAIVIDPAILPGDQHIRLDLLLDSAPTLTLTAPLANVTVNKTHPEQNQRPTVGLAALAVLYSTILACVVIFAIIFTTLIAGIIPGARAVRGVILFGVLTALFAVVAVAAIRRFRRQ
jgi:hypothetical protein